ncbi:MAG: sugar transferase [Syntrophorhabdaceae bacterium]
MTRKRLFDLTFTVPGLFLLAPLFLIVALLIKFDSPGPVFFRQVRLGQFGRPFRIYKFRTMVDRREKSGLNITLGKDGRITKLGGILRKFKIDEFPQLINVLKGEMSLVGPRPEVPEYVKEYPPHARAVVLSVQPGITDFASIEYRDENLLLGTAGDPEKIYLEQILPIKVAYYTKYVQESSLLLDLRLILATVKAVYCRKRITPRKTNKEHPLPVEACPTQVGN